MKWFYKQWFEQTGAPEWKLTWRQETNANPVTRINLKITSLDGTWAIASAFEGENISITNEKTKIGFVLVPTVLNEKTRTVEVKVFQIADGKTAESPTETLNRCNEFAERQSIVF